MSQSTQKFDIDNQQLSLAGSDLSISKGNTVTLPLEIPIGGTSGQLLAKQSDTNYDVTWVNEAPASSYTSVIKHRVKAGESLTKGQAVYVSSANGTNMVVTKASNTSEATSSKTMGLIAQTLANNGQGDIIAEGLLSGLNTNTAIIGDPVWLGTNGNLIYGLTNKPYAPAHLVFIGIVIRVSATVGEIFVKVQNGFELNEIHDVDLKTTPPVNGDVLGYNGTLWVNKSITGLGGQTQLNGTGFVKASGTTISYDNSTYLSTSSASSTYLPISNPTATGTLTAPTIANSLGATFATSSGNVGIGTASPSDKLTVNTSGSGTGFKIIGYQAENFINLNNSLSTGNRTFRLLAGITSVGYQGFSIFDNVAAETRFVINNNGNVGIGVTTDSGYKLDVNGTLRTVNDAYFATSSGNVGIGTNAPSIKLDIRGAGGSTLLNLSANSNTTGYVLGQIANAGGATYFGADNNTGSAFGLGAYASVFGAGGTNSLSLITSSLPRINITSGGNVGIGTLTPTSKLQVVDLLEYATNALAITGGLTIGAFYHTAGVVKVVI